MLNAYHFSEVHQELELGAKNTSLWCDCYASSDACYKNLHKERWKSGVKSWDNEKPLFLSVHGWNKIKTK
jgi:hypothetical protein